MSETVTLTKEIDVDVRVYVVEIGPKSVEFTLTVDNDGDLIINIEEDEAIEALKYKYDTDELIEMIKD